VNKGQPDTPDFVLMHAPKEISDLLGCKLGVKMPFHVKQGKTKRTHTHISEVENMG
jgi:hypothetical protein